MDDQYKGSLSYAYVNINGHVYSRWDASSIRLSERLFEERDFVESVMHPYVFLARLDGINAAAVDVLDAQVSSLPTNARMDAFYCLGYREQDKLT